MTSRRNVLFGSVGLAAVGGSAPASAVSVTRPGTAFGTTVRLIVTAESEAAANLAIDAGYAEIRAVHRAADLFHAESEIARINTCGELETASTIFSTLVEKAEELFTLSGGAFDASVQPLWKLWSQSGGQRPNEVSLRSALARVNWRNLRMRNAGYDLENSAALTFNGLAQGYAADLVMQVLQRHGVHTAHIDTGETGMLRCHEGLPIKHPRRQGLVGTLHIDSGFVAISGDYASKFSDDFLNHHIIDPRSGYSPRELASVAVVAPTGVMADGLATAFMVMGQEKSLSCLAGLPGHAALFVSKTGETTMSPGMRPLFKTLAI
jgi:FAD:protein FMN transferase